MEEGIGQIFSWRKSGMNLEAATGKVTVLFNYFKLFSTPYSEQPSRLAN